MFSKALSEKKNLLFGSLETLAHILPVDNVPDSLDIIWPHILVLKIVGMLPDVNTKKRDETYGSETETIIGLMRKVTNGKTSSFGR